MTTLLDLYDSAVEKLLERGYPAKDKKSGNCYYRHPTTGAPCLVGLMIDDYFYSRELEYCSFENGVGQAIRDSNKIEEKFRPEEYEWLALAQNVHDNCSPTLWKKRFAELRDQYPGEIK